MLNGLTREVRWREATAEKPQRTGGCFLVAHFNSDGKALVRDALWDGTKFIMSEYPYRPIRTVTHWAPFPELPKEDAMRRVFRELLGTNKEESPC